MLRHNIRMGETLMAKDSGFTFAIISHARKEPYFISLWARYYGAIFGSENLYLMKDGDDWDLPETAEIGTVKTVRFDDDRRTTNEEFAKMSSTWANELLGRYDIVLRMDIDEFLCVDPENGSWDKLAQECIEAGHLYALGMDVIQDRVTEAPLDPHSPILSQRRYAKITGAYCKPHAVSQPVNWTSACHTIVDVPVRLSKMLYMFHLASMDYDVMQSRIQNRGHLEDRSYSGHIKNRVAQFAKMGDCKIVPYEQVEKEVRKKVEFDDDGNRKFAPRFKNFMRHRPLHVMIPEKFKNII